MVGIESQLEEHAGEEKSVELIELAQIKRQLTQILNLHLRQFIEQTSYFKLQPEGAEQDEYEVYELNEIFATYLRCFHLLKNEQYLYREIQVSVCIPVIDKHLKETLGMRQTQQSFHCETAMKDLPIEHFFKNVNENLIGNCLKNLLSITNPSDDPMAMDHYVPHYNFFKRCVWSYIHKNLIQDGPLNFMVSTASLQQFNQNFHFFNSEVIPLYSKLLEGDREALVELKRMFNLEAYMNIFHVELVDYYQKNLFKMWNCTND